VKPRDEGNVPGDNSIPKVWRLSLIKQRPALSLISNLVLILLWFWLFRPVYPYLATIFTRQEFRINQIVLLAALTLLAWQLRKGTLRVHFSQPPQLYTPALALMLIGAIGFVLADRFLDVNTLSAILFGLGSYGFLGLWMDPSRWRQGLPAALLLVGALPLGEHMQTFIGYPVRILTAEIVGQGLTALGSTSTSLDTILVFESGITQVDLPCSGVKSLWTGGLFLIAATWIDRRPINLRWGAVALTFGALLLLANLIRVGVLVTAGMVMDWRLLAEMLHIPLGVLGFVGACAAAVLMLNWTDSYVHDAEPDVGSKDVLLENHPARTWMTPLLVCVILVLILLYSPRPQDTFVEASRAWIFPEDVQTNPWMLTSGELEWLGSGGALSGNRWRFTRDDLSGSLLVITSNTWRAQHRPERCFLVYGLTVENSYTILTDTGSPIRYLSLGDGSDQSFYTAVYWFQSRDQVTDDYATRIWADMAIERQTWALVTILMDAPLDPDSDEMQELYPVMRQLVAHNLGGG
jgi:exosortase O